MVAASAVLGTKVCRCFPSTTTAWEDRKGETLPLPNCSAHLTIVNKDYRNIPTVGEGGLV